MEKAPKEMIIFPTRIDFLFQTFNNFLKSVVDRAALFLQ